MNKLIKIYGLLFIGLLLGICFFESCTKEPTLFPPTACFTMVRDSAGIQTPLEDGGFIYAGDQIFFSECGSYEKSTFYNGKKGSSYDKDYGDDVIAYGGTFAVRGTVNVAYPDAGVVKPTLLVVNYSGDNVLRDMMQVKITVKPKPAP